MTAQAAEKIVNSNDSIFTPQQRGG